MTSVTTKDMIDEVRKIASQDPERVYGQGTGSCSYFGRAVSDMTGQCCIIGQAFKNLEVDTEKLLSTEGSGSSPTIVLAVREKFVDVVVGHRDELKWLDEVQRGQDRGETWGGSVESADEDFSVKL